MFPKPKPALAPNTYAYESEPLVKPTGFREYDARWLLGKEINLMGVQALGLGLGRNILDHIPDRVPLPVQLNLARLDSGDMSCLVDKPVEPLGFLIDDCNQLMLLCDIRNVGSEQSGRCRPYRRQRCLEFVGEPIQ